MLALSGIRKLLTSSWLHVTEDCYVSQVLHHLTPMTHQTVPEPTHQPVPESRSAKICKPSCKVPLCSGTDVNVTSFISWAASAMTAMNKHLHCILMVAITYFTTIIFKITLSINYIILITHTKCSENHNNHLCEHVSSHVHITNFTINIIISTYIDKLAVMCPRYQITNFINTL